MSSLLLGSSNPAKVAQLHSLVDGGGITLLLPSDVGPLPHVEEGATSLQANAAAKATAWARAVGVVTLASDGGLEVPALGDRWQAVRTHRAAGEAATAAEQAAHLLHLARTLRGAARRAYQVEVVALAHPTGQLIGTWEGRSKPLLLATSYVSDALPLGFWVPGILLYEGRRYAVAQELGLTEQHWHCLREPVCQIVTRLLGGGVASV